MFLTKTSNVPFANILKKAIVRFFYKIRRYFYLHIADINKNSLF